MDWTFITWLAVLIWAWLLLAPNDAPAAASANALATSTAGFVRMAASQRIILHTARSTWERPHRRAWP
jgi:hypothetical protein